MYDPDRVHETDEFKFAIKKMGNKYVTWQTNKLIFADALEYMGGHGDLRSYLKCFLPDLDVASLKLFFPYELLADVKNLDVPGLPPYEAFHSDLQGANVLEEGTQSRVVGEKN